MCYEWRSKPVGLRKQTNCCFSKAPNKPAFTTESRLLPRRDSQYSLCQWDRPWAAINRNASRSGSDLLVKRCDRNSVRVCGGFLLPRLFYKKAQVVLQSQRELMNMACKQNKACSVDPTLFSKKGAWTNQRAIGSLAMSLPPWGSYLAAQRSDMYPGKPYSKLSGRVAK